MSPATIKRYLAQLRKHCIDNESDIITKRIAYEMETAIRHVTERTVGWPTLTQQARSAAVLLKKELGLEK